MEQKVKLGDRVMDKITGLQEVVVARTEWLYGESIVLVQQEHSGDKTQYPEEIKLWERQVEVIESAPLPIHHR